MQKERFQILFQILLDIADILCVYKLISNKIAFLFEKNKQIILEKVRHKIKVRA